jgi:aspartate-semialdehyde dehydrogenase
VVRAPIVFSALDATAAAEIEPAFARAGRLVLSNAKCFRMEPDVPLVIPEVNAGHLAALDAQRAGRGWSGGIVTNANCAATGATVALAPLHEAFGVEQVMVVTMQALSGAGYPGVPALDGIGNVIPYIADEEQKIEREIPKLLGRWSGTAFEPADVLVSAQANRVPVEHGHLTCLAIKFRTRPTRSEALEVLRAWQGAPAARGLPSSPPCPLVVLTEADRPQPRRDVGLGGGMTVSVGRVRADPILDLRLVALAHNVIRGAAGGSILNAEVLAATGRLPAAPSGAA